MKCTFDDARSRSLRPSSTGDYRVLIAVAHLSVYHAISSLYLTCTHPISMKFDATILLPISLPSSEASAVVRGHQHRPLPLG